MPLSIRLKSRAAAFVGAYLLIWLAAAGYLAAKGADWTLPATLLVIFGAVLPLLGIALTRKAVPPLIRVGRPTLELCALLVFLVVYAVALLGWGMSATRAVFPPGREQDLLVLAVKLSVHVAAPALLLAMLGAKIAP